MAAGAHVVRRLALAGRVLDFGDQGAQQFDGIEIVAAAKPAAVIGQQMRKIPK